jgi:hypothetical protein
MRNSTIFVLAAFAAAPLSAQAQQGGTAVASTPGKAAAVTIAEVTATVTAVDKASRTVTLKAPKGNEVDIVAGPEVRNFDQIKVGDQVTAQYQESLTLELKKTKGKLDATEKSGAARAAVGDRPAGAVGREVRVLADVVKVDQPNSIISLKGPKGRVVDLKVRNQDHFKVVKVGDQVEAVYTEAIAVAVSPAPKSAAKK